MSHSRVLDSGVSGVSGRDSGRVSGRVSYRKSSSCQILPCLLLLLYHGVATSNTELDISL